MAFETMFIDQFVAGNGIGVASITVNITPAFPDSIGRFYYILVSSNDQAGADHRVSGVTVGGVAATLVRETVGGVASSIYKFKQPPKTSVNVVVSFVSSTVNARVCVYELEYCDPVNPVGAQDGAFGTGTADTRVLNPVAAPSILLEHLGVFNGTTTTTATLSSPFSADDNSLVGSSPFRTRGMSGNAQLQVGSINCPITIAVSKAYAHQAIECQAERQFPLQSLVGMGV